MNNDIKYWWYQPGVKKDGIPSKWNDFRKKGIMAIDSEGMRNLNKFKTYDAIREWFIKNNKITSKGNLRTGDIQCNHDFANNMRIGDIVLVKNGTTQCIGFGFIKSDYKFDSNYVQDNSDNSKIFDSFREVDWYEVEPWDIDNAKYHIYQRKTLGNITSKSKFIQEFKKRYNITSQSGQYLYPEELVNHKLYIEGAVKQITVNAYERDKKAREECLRDSNFNCKICDFNFEDKYGEIGAKFIHVHHIRPLSEIEQEYEVDPHIDLVPVCPNCHAMLHRKNPPYSLEDIRKMLKIT